VRLDHLDDLVADAVHRVERGQRGPGRSSPRAGRAPG
jgi:hypothetical protein